MEKQNNISTERGLLPDSDSQTKYEPLDMNPHKNHPVVYHGSLAYLLGTLILSIFLGEILITLLINNLHPSSLLGKAMLDSTLLTVLVLPILYFFVYRPLRNRINEQNQTENPLIEEQYLMRILMDNLPDHIYFKDKASRFIRINKEHAKKFGLNDPTQAIGKTDFDFFTEEHAAQAFGDEQTIIRTGQILRLEEKETYHDRPDTWVSTVKLPLHDKVGNIIGTFGISRDISENKQIEKDLKKSEERYRTLVENMGEGVGFLNPEEIFEFANSTAEKIFGVGSGGLLGLSLFEFLTDKNFEVIKIQTQQRIQGKSSVYEHEIVLKDGSKKYILVTATPSFDGEIFIGAFGIFRDVTERRLTEMALAKSEAIYRNLIERMPDGVYKSTYDGRFINVNPAMVKMLGFDNREDLMAIDIKRQLYFDLAEHDTLLEKDNTDVMGVFKLRRKDGTVIWVEDHGWHTTDESGNILFHEGIIRNITERIQIEKALRISEERLELFFSQSLDGFFFMMLDEPVLWNDTVDKDKALDYVFEHQHITKCNYAMAQQYLAKQEKFIGLTPKDIYSFDIEYGKRFWREFFDKGKLHIETNEQRFDGSQMWVEGDYICLYDSQRRIIGHFGIQRDVTQRKRVEEEIKLKNEQLTQAHAEKDKFFSIIAHDLRSPFNGFLGLTQIMAEEVLFLTKDELRNIAISMRSSATNLYRLLDNLLEWARMQQGLILFNPKKLELLPIVDETILMMVEPAKRKGIEISSDISADTVVYADNYMLQSVIQNLVSNAVKFTRKGGKINVLAKAIDDFGVEILVNDTGIGMSPKMVDNLFKLDVQTNRKGTEGELSTGLGLLLCKEFVEKHGGKIWVESEDGKASSFHFTIPNKMIKEGGHGLKNIAVEINEEKQVHPPVTSLKILVVEDDEGSARLLAVTIKSISKEILVVKNGLEAVEICRNNPDIDLILMDIQMPGIDGYEATRQIRKFNGTVVIIAQTAFALNGDQEKSTEAGCNDYIAKPITKKELLELLLKYFKN